MSRGLGRTQRAILAHLDAHGDSYFQVIVGATVPGAIPRNTYESYRRAMRSLEDAGRITVRKDWSARDWRLSVAGSSATLTPTIPPPAERPITPPVPETPVLSDPSAPVLSTDPLAALRWDAPGHRWVGSRRKLPVGKRGAARRAAREAEDKAAARMIGRLSREASTAVGVPVECTSSFARPWSVYVITGTVRVGTFAVQDTAFFAWGLTVAEAEALLHDLIQRPDRLHVAGVATTWTRDDSPQHLGVES